MALEGRLMVAPGVEVVVRDIAAGGSGIGDLPDGRVVFVPRTAPGDRARIRIEKSKPRWAVGSLQRLIEPGPDRVDAPCPLYAECGGCHLQHLPYERQLEAKARFVADALRRIGGIEHVQPPEVVGSPRIVQYRNRITFTLRRLRRGHVVAGFHALGRPAHVIDVHAECVLPASELRDAWVRLRAGWGAGARHLPGGGRLRLTLRLTSAGVELVVHGGERGWDPGPLTLEVQCLSAVWHVHSGAVEKPTLVAGVSGPGGGTAFVQVNAEAAALLRFHVMDVTRSDRPDGETAPSAGLAIDAYGGTGEYGRALARAGWTVVAVESDGAAVEEAAADAPVGFEAVVGRVEDRLADLLPAGLLLVNPPRAGLHADIPAIINSQPPPRLVYVSCDPATLARDVRALADQYDLTSLRCFDLFPQTAHIESVAVLSSREGTA
jgi:23S rRNA (uracil1939-C5)-methyltransferase